MRKITLLAALFISMMFVACQNSDLELAQMENLTDGSQIIPLRETFDFTYKGVTYSSPYYIQGDTLMVLEDEKVAAVYENLQELPELATRIKDNGDVEYFDSYSELETKTQKNKIASRSADYTIYLYEHSDYNFNKQGKSKGFQHGGSVPDLSVFSINMDECISSFNVRYQYIQTIYGTSSITFFRNKNYEAQSITFEYNRTPTFDNRFGDQNNYVYASVTNFKNYKVKRGINWNDRISSFKSF